MVKTLHVIPRDGQWVVARQGSKGDRLFPTQRQAIETAKVIVKKEGSGQVVVHQRDGRARAQDMYTYGMPPIQDPPGKKSAKIERAVDKITRDRLEADCYGHVINPSDQVFVNCPFDEAYKPLFDAIVFAITDLGFYARSAREEDDAGEFRLAKIERIIEECKYGVHDLSAVKLDGTHQLPRFNMPLELGLFLGCKRYGGRRQRYKVSLIFDADPYRYHIFISDIAGQDIHAHGGDVTTAIRELRTWLATASKRKKLPGGRDIFSR